MRRRAWFLVPGLMLAVCACAHGRASRSEPTPVKSNETVRLNVINHYTVAVDVYAQAEGTSYRMGKADPEIPSRFMLRRAMLGDGPVEFVAIPADGVYVVRSGQLLLVAGDIVDWVIANHLRHSVATVRHPH